MWSPRKQPASRQRLGYLEKHKDPFIDILLLLYIYIWREREREIMCIYIYTYYIYIHTYVCVYIYIYMCIHYKLWLSWFDLSIVCAYVCIICLFSRLFIMYVFIMYVVMFV